MNGFRAFGAALLAGAVLVAADRTARVLWVDTVQGRITGCEVVREISSSPQPGLPGDDVARELLEIEIDEGGTARRVRVKTLRPVREACAIGDAVALAVPRLAPTDIRLADDRIDASGLFGLPLVMAAAGGLLLASARIKDGKFRK
ncbi:MAG: hypothetical protein KKD25_12260 [Gammaproteobacteria bacterium]|nr:hypothetical protein [Gammaproteobacteria bacterium]MBU0770885.1 hypothetical protein [Gammaproteobacteria bacterium]MBU0855398.1 hypothetical protein [Gammaproteobacteria bacterium]MBU1845485.1 hypothetical protein [Gammaproteobacteria bacterium]